MGVLVFAFSVGREEFIVGAAIDCKGSTSVIEPDDGFSLDLVCRTGLDPIA